MPRTQKAPSRMEILVLSSLARRPMHGYEIKLELRYKHVRFWAKADHGHLYGTLTRLEKQELITGDAPAGGRGRRTFTITDAGRQRLVDSVRTLGAAPDQTWFDVDLFLSSSFLLPRDEVLALLTSRRAALEEQLAEASGVKARMSEHIPLAGHLILAHRVDHLEREIAFGDRVSTAIREAPTWGSFLGQRAIEVFLEETGAGIEG